MWWDKPYFFFFVGIVISLLQQHKQLSCFHRWLYLKPCMLCASGFLRNKPQNVSHKWKYICQRFCSKRLVSGWVWLNLTHVLLYTSSDLWCLTMHLLPQKPEEICEVLGLCTTHKDKELQQLQRHLPSKDAFGSSLGTETHVSLRKQKKKRN